MCDELVGEEVNICTESEVSIGELAKNLIDEINPNAKIVLDESRLRPKNSEVMRLYGSNQKLRRLTDWDVTFTLANGLHETVKWFKNPENLAKYNSLIYNI